MQISVFALFAQNHAARVSEFVRKRLTTLRKRSIPCYAAALLLTGKRSLVCKPTPRNLQARHFWHSNQA